MGVTSKPQTFGAGSKSAKNPKWHGAGGGEVASQIPKIF